MAIQCVECRLYAFSLSFIFYCKNAETILLGPVAGCNEHCGGHIKLLLPSLYQPISVYGCMFFANMLRLFVTGIYYFIVLHLSYNTKSYRDQVVARSFYWMIRKQVHMLIIQIVMFLGYFDGFEIVHKFHYSGFHMFCR